MEGYIIAGIIALLILRFVFKTVKFTFKLIIFAALTAACILFLKNFFPNLFILPF